MIKTIVIIGGGHAGFHMASSLRQNGFHGRIILIEKQPFYPYQRPPLSKSYLCGDIKLEQLFFRNEHFYKTNKIELIFGEVTAILKEKKAVVCNNQMVFYDELVLALGSVPKKLELYNKFNNVYYIADLHSTEILKKKLTEVKDVVIVGGGFVGLEFACIANKLGINTHVIVKNNKLLSRSVSNNLSEIIRNKHISDGIQINFESSIDKILISNNSIYKVKLSTSHEIKSDIIIVGIGSIVNDGIAFSSGLKTDNGIVVNEYLCTSDPNIYAIGDCASFLTELNEYSRLESVQNAVDQAKYLSSWLTGHHKDKYKSFPWFWSDQGEMKIQIAGNVKQGNYSVLKGCPTNTCYVNYCFNKKTLVAVETINSTLVHMAARQLFTQNSNNLPDLYELQKYSFDLVKLVKEKNKHNI
ncbi:NAD(P)/FAD-dependent oxidoreductase [Gilliamella sp. WF3-4]|uniref:NAD(P)/FAD-dependent oxidoreductase n=1 Tax=Gilliamella sp. WF3-4 TaxID=3120255 RepID=UPI0009BF79B2|nr:FAD-dependent oxidoreductase [Gilliamella apicola]